MQQTSSPNVFRAPVLARAAWCAFLCLILATASCGGGGGSGSGGSPERSDSLLVGAHYYVWFPQNFAAGYLRDRLTPPQGPLLGEYSSRSPEAAAQHIEWAANHGVDFFTLDWWPTRPEQNAAIDRGILAAPNLSRIKFCIFYETIDLGFVEERLHTTIDAEARVKLVTDLEEIARKYFSHPQYLRIDDRPVVFFYVTRTLTGQYREAFTEARARLQSLGFNPFFIGDEIYWHVATEGAAGPTNTDQPNIERIKLFDAITSYNMYAPSLTSQRGYGAESTFLSDIRAIYERYRLAAPEVPLVPGLIPGYNDRGHRPALDHFPIARPYAPGAEPGSFLRESFSQIGLPFLDNDLRMVVITSWNEWNEDTAIEPHLPSEPTSSDRAGGRFTGGFPYGGTGFEALEAVRDFSETP